LVDAIDEQVQRQTTREKQAGKYCRRNNHACMAGQIRLERGLRRLNQELGADFDPISFRIRALWNCAESRIEMHLESTLEHRVRIMAANVDVHFAKCETIHTENSYKFTPETIRSLLEDASFCVD
jgi:uncharacterized SAM-dependent methyltransferase